MKRCPKCNRTYSDETLSFCLADGALLSASFDADATLRLSGPGDAPALPKDSTSIPPESTKPNRRHFGKYVLIALVASLLGAGLVLLVVIISKDSSIRNTQNSTLAETPGDSELTTPLPNSNKSEINPKRSAETLDNSSASPVVKVGQFRVSASSFQGSPFTNPVNRPASIEFSAAGEWTFWPDQGFHSAAGNPGYPVASQSGADYKLPSAALGSLIVLRSNGTYEYVGVKRTIRLGALERVFFVMNDSKIYSASYQDNKGALNVRWNCSDCN